MSLNDRMKVLIHTCPKRSKYVSGFLIPKLVESGVNRSDIFTFEDKCGISLFATMQSFLYYGERFSDYDIWNLQDDVLPCRHFWSRTFLPVNGDYPMWNGIAVVCGFFSGCSKASTIDDMYFYTPDNMPWSFPCIRIKGQLMRECAEWFFTDILGKKELYRLCTGKFDDYFFKEFLKEKYPDLKIARERPDLVDHIDFLLGGSTIGNDHERISTDPLWARSLYFHDREELVDEARRWIATNM